MRRPRITFEFHHEDGDRELRVEMSYARVVDGNWGADADGRRGIHMEWNEDADFKVFLGKEDVTAQLAPEVAAAIEKAVDEHMENSAGYDDEPDYGPDPDDERDRREDR